MLADPILRVFGMEVKFTEVYNSAEYKQKIKEIEEKTKYLEHVSLEDIGEDSEDAGELVDGIQIEEIQVGD